MWLLQDILFTGQTKKILPAMVFELLEDKLNKKANETIDKMTDLYRCVYVTSHKLDIPMFTSNQILTVIRFMIMTWLPHYALLMNKGDIRLHEKM